MGRVIHPEWLDTLSERLTVKLASSCEAEYTVPVLLIFDGSATASVAHILVTSNRDHVHCTWGVQTSSVET